MEPVLRQVRVLGILGLAVLELGRKVLGFLGQSMPRTSCTSTMTRLCIKMLAFFHKNPVKIVWTHVSATFVSLWCTARSNRSSQRPKAQATKR